MSRIAEWKALNTQLKVVKANEAQLRRDLVDEISPNPDLSKGRCTTKLVLDGFNVKAVQTLNYSLDKAALGAIWNNLSEAERNAVKLVPELKLKEYKALPEDSILHEAITTKPAMPTLEAVEPGE